MNQVFRRWRNGGLTVFLSLILAVLLVVFQVCLQSARNAFYRSQTEEALELLEISLLSEYHRELFEKYQLFCLDLGYGTGVEDMAYFKERTQQFLIQNLPDGEIRGLEIMELSRLTDEKGLAFYEQAVSYAKQQAGASWLEVFKNYEELGKLAGRKEEEYIKKEARETANLEKLKRRREETEQEDTEDPVSEIKELKESSILNLVLKDPGQVSGKVADLSRTPSVRENLSGIGARGKYQGNITNDMFFHMYLKEHFTDAVDCFKEEKAPGNWLDYQLEYIIAGKNNDIDNLEAVAGRLLAIREGINYAYLQTDAAKIAECEALAVTAVGITMIPGLIEAMKQVLLLTWAFAESVMDVRLLLGGKAVDFWKSQNSWKTSLSKALDISSSGSETLEEGDEQGLSYEEYLCILLTLTVREKKTCRSLDVIEGEIRGTIGNPYFYIDQCVDSFWLRTVIFNGQEWSSQRLFCYEW